MIPQQTDLDMLMFLENIFETHISDEFAEQCGDPLGMEQLLERAPSWPKDWTEHGEESRLAP